MLKSSIITVALLTAGHGALAQQRPDAGRQIQQIPPTPALQAPVPDITVQRRETPSDPEAAGASIRVNSLRLTGQTLFPADVLIGASGFEAGRELTLADLRELAARISAYYNQRGYFLAQAYLPAQDIEDGIVTIAVIEGQYGKIDLRNQTNLSDRVARRVLSGLESGDIVATKSLERRLLLLSDIPGVLVKSTLSPGSAVGTSDLTVDLDPGRRVTGSVEADNGGNRFTGAYRFGGTVNLNNPTGIGDLLSLRVLASTEGLTYGRASYQALFGVSTVGVAYSHIDYRLGREFKSLDADGSADVVNLYGSYPLVRSRDANLYALAGFDANWFEDRVGAASTVTRRETRVLTLGLSGDNRDSLGGGGWNSYSIGGTFGDLNIRTPADLALDRATARSDGNYGKLQASFARLQTLTGPLSLYAAVRGQVASKNLDSSEKMELGGAYGVRAYPEGEAFGDEGYLATAELRYALPEFAPLPGRLQAFGFVDAGAVRFAKDPWFAGPNVARRSGIGAGLAWAAPNDFIVKGTYAHRLGDAESTADPGSNGRFWFQIAKIF